MENRCPSDAVRCDVFTIAGDQQLYMEWRTHVRQLYKKANPQMMITSIVPKVDALIVINKGTVVDNDDTTLLLASSYY